MNDVDPAGYRFAARLDDGAAVELRDRNNKLRLRHLQTQATTVPVDVRSMGSKTVRDANEPPDYEACRRRVVCKVAMNMLSPVRLQQP